MGLAERAKSDRKDWNEDLKAETKAGGTSFLQRLRALEAAVATDTPEEETPEDDAPTPTP